MHEYRSRLSRVVHRVISSEHSHDRTSSNPIKPNSAAAPASQAL